MHRTYGVMKSRMSSSGKNEIQQSSLGNTSQTLEIPMLDDIKQDFMGNFDETVNRIVDDFEFVGHEVKLMIVDKNKDF